MVGIKKDRSGQRFGKLRVIVEAPNINNCTRWHCWCDCGQITTVYTASLVTGNTSSCGCGMHPKTHGWAKTPTQKSWILARQRCNNPNDDHYKNYGGRGIKVCNRWDKFENFLKDMGKRPEGKTLDRIDVNGNYEPKNCRWATAREQCNNTRRNVFLTYNGETLTIAQWSRRTGINYSTIQNRVKQGHPIEEVLIARN